MRNAPQTTRGPARMARRSAFTLVELLVVMGIILILASLITFAASGYYRRAMVTRAEATITLLALGLEDYKNTYGSYPYHDPADDNTSPKKLSGAITTATDADTFDIRNIYYLLRDRTCIKDPIDNRYRELADGASAGDDSDYIVLDAWLEPIVYRFPRQADDGQFDLWSKGPDKADSRAAAGDTVDPSDMSDTKNNDNIVWGQFNRR